MLALAIGCFEGTTFNWICQLNLPLIFNLFEVYKHCLLNSLSPVLVDPITEYSFLFIAIKVVFKNLILVRIAECSRSFSIGVFKKKTI